MNSTSRRRFLTLAVAGTVEPGKRAQAATAGRELFTFRAVAGLPAKPFPSYASYVIQGHVDIVRSTGIVTKTVFAGAPEAMSTIVLPGLFQSSGGQE